MHRHEASSKHKQEVHEARSRATYSAPNPHIAQLVAAPLQEILMDLSEGPYRNTSPTRSTASSDNVLHFEDVIINKPIPSEPTYHFDVDPSDSAELQPSILEAAMARFAEDMYEYLYYESSSDSSESDNGDNEDFEHIFEQEASFGLSPCWILDEYLLTLCAR